MLSRLLLAAAICVAIGANNGSARAAIPCDHPYWPRNTRTLPTICPEVVVEKLSAVPGRSALMQIGFDAENALYVTRPASGEVLHYPYREDMTFGPPTVYRTGFDTPVAALWTLGLIEADKQLSRGFARGPDGVLWKIEAGDRVVASDGRTIPLAAHSDPVSIAFYAGDAFPEMRGGLLIVTGGSRNTPELAGYELLVVDTRVGTKTLLVPANTGGKNSSEASIYYLSFYPDHPVAVMVDHNGWIYVGLREGQVMRFRPR